ncbi:MAG: hypothetical protein E6I76_00900 [Chloroflexi bacterium]|nr:MAG: hypothetical protein E6I76_00900 [Chloroflexota bacterium]
MPTIRWHVSSKNASNDASVRSAGSSIVRVAASTSCTRLTATPRGTWRGGGCLPRYASGMAKPLTLTDSTFRARVIESPIPAVVDFWASWNSTCKALAPSLDVLSEEYDGRAVIAKLDIDANPQTAALFAVLAVPTLILFRGAEAVRRIDGYRPIEVLRDELDQLLAAV